MPGSLQMQNIIPTQILGTALTAAPVEGVLATLFMIVVGVGYLYWQVKKGHNDPEAAIELYQVQGGRFWTRKSWSSGLRASGSPCCPWW